MFVRGDTSATEYKRNDQTIYKAIVIKNNDPLMLYRVKLFIPEISNQPFEKWLHDYKELHMKFPGKNNEKDIWKDPEVFELIAQSLPWAEPCFPLWGENSPALYNKPEEVAIISDTIYEDGYETNNEEPPSTDKGAFSPSFIYESYEYMMGDKYANPSKYFTRNNNPYCYSLRPSTHVNKAKGMFCVPSVGSQVWVFFYNGNANFPVYFGTRHNYRENILITNADNNEKYKTLDYPNVFENEKFKDE